MTQPWAQTARYILLTLPQPNSAHHKARHLKDRLEPDEAPDPAPRRLRPPRADQNRINREGQVPLEEGRERRAREPGSGVQALQVHQQRRGLVSA